MNTLLMAGAALGPETITNGGMESGNPPSSWNAGVDTPTLASVSDAHSGSSGTKSMDIQIAVAQTSATVLQDISSLYGNSTYRLQFWYKNIDASSLVVVIYNSDYSQYIICDYVTLTAWSMYSRDINIPYTSAHIAVVVNGTAGQHFRLDDFSLRRV